MPLLPIEEQSQFLNHIYGDHRAVDTVSAHALIDRLEEYGDPTNEVIHKANNPSKYEPRPENVRSIYADGTPEDLQQLRIDHSHDGWHRSWLMEPVAENRFNRPLWARSPEGIRVQHQATKDFGPNSGGTRLMRVTAYYSPEQARLLADKFGEHAEQIHAFLDHHFPHTRRKTEDVEQFARKYGRALKESS